MKRLLTSHKRKLLAQLVELYVFFGHDISDIMGRPLSYFDYVSVEKRIKELQTEQDKNN